ncbi:uncharacterized protein METZ01_LOCUS498536, partial [marine metagenome]
QRKKQQSGLLLKTLRPLMFTLLKFRF